MAFGGLKAGVASLVINSLVSLQAVLGGVELAAEVAGVLAPAPAKV